MRPPFSFLLGLCFSCQMLAQPSPSGLIVFELDYLADTSIAIFNPQYLTGFNQGQYNNQPAFISEHEILFTTILPGETQTDIYYLDLKNLHRKRITFTEESEYSPLPVDRDHFSTIRVNEDKQQELWKYATLPEGNFMNLVPKNQNIGYYCWLRDSLIALFLVEDPPLLQIADVAMNRFNSFSSDIGRCLQKNRIGNLIYLHKYSDKFWYLKEFDPTTKRATIITEVGFRSEDFTLLDDESILMVDDGVLYRFNLKNTTGWKKVQDLRAFGISSATRMAYRSGKLVMVIQN